MQNSDFVHSNARLANVSLIDQTGLPGHITKNWEVAVVKKMTKTLNQASVIKYLQTFAI